MAPYTLYWNKANQLISTVLRGGRGVNDQDKTTNVYIMKIILGLQNELNLTRLDITIVPIREINDENLLD